MTDIRLDDLDRAPDGAEVLDDVHAFLGRYIAYPSDAAHVAHTLWIAHTHLMDCWESTPRIAFLSPEPGSGKTRALEASELLVPRPIQAVNTTSAYLFRKVSDEAGAPTLLYDEIDTVFGEKARDNEDIRGMLNAGHRRGAVAGRCVVRGKHVFTEELPAYCAVAVAGLGDLPDTILTRCVIVAMRRRAPHERIEPYRRREVAPVAEKLYDRLAGWCASARHLCDGAWPDMPDGIADRAADVWEALLAVADAAGGGWPQRARVSAVTLVTLSMGRTPSLGVRLLADLRDVFGDRDAMSTDAILAAPHGIDEAPWGDIKGAPLAARGLASRLRRYEVRSKTVRIGDTTAKGYTREDLHDPWARYVPKAVGQPPKESVTSVTSATCRLCGDPLDPVHAEVGTHPGCDT
jgi:hypothetical protein